MHRLDPISFDATPFEDADRLQDLLADCDFLPYIDFEIITVTLSDGALEVDPKGNLPALLPHLRDFAGRRGYRVCPLDPDTGTVSLLRTAPENSAL